jgi:hypothetical protein
MRDLIDQLVMVAWGCALLLVAIVVWAARSDRRR